MLIDFSYLFKKYNVEATGIIHIGAHYGQEAQAYWDMGIRKAVFVEAFRPTYKILCRNMAKFQNFICVNACITDKDGQIVPFNVSNNEGQSSSILEFDTHATQHPTIKMQSRTRLQTATIQTVLKERKLSAEDYNFVNIDIQGAELMALKGMDLSYIDYAYIEINEEHLYKDCPLVSEIDAYLSGFGLERVETKMTGNGWGDAFYVRKLIERPNMVTVPHQYQPKHPFAYPGDNDIDFERYYLINYEGHEGRTYLPIMWTAIYCKNRTAIHGLQKFIDSLDKSKKYYTIVQYDDGILNNVSGIDLKVFSMSGKGDYYLPLICKPHQFPPAQNRDIYCSFVGRNTHPIRAEILQLKHPGWIISDKVQKLSTFCDTLSRSVFTLCPRGYGPTSFRIAEAMQYGSIPVYISDVFIEPHGIPFDYYGVKVAPGQDIREALSKVDILAKQAAIKEIYHQYFTYESNRSIIRQEAERMP